MPGRCMLRNLSGCRLVVARNHPHRPLERSGSYPNADRHCCIDLALLRGLRPVREARGIGARTPASRRAGKNRAGRRYGARQIRMQRRDDFDFATWLPRQHGACPAPSRAVYRPGTLQFPTHREPTADGRDAMTRGCGWKSVAS
jgi:hypothetical protein